MALPTTHYAGLATESVRLISRTYGWSPMSALEFLRLFPGEVRVYWESGTGHALAGAGAVATLAAEGPDRFESIRQQAARLFDGCESDSEAPPAVGPQLFGGFAFTPDSSPDPLWSAFSGALFILPRYQLTNVEGRSWLTINTLQSERKNLDAVHCELETLRTRLFHTLASNGHAAQVQVQTLMQPEQWDQIVGGAVTRIRRGELEKVVLARACRVTSSQAIDPVTVLSRLGAKYPETVRFLIEPAAGHAFFGATPELLADVQGSEVRTAALAASIRRGATPAEDAALGESLLASPKEHGEHALVVDALRENLSSLTHTLDIDPQPHLHRLSNIQHLRTDLRGALAPGVDALRVVEALHPTPALGGTPCDLALQLIADSEPLPRGWYGGPVGWLDAEGNGLFAVAIRAAVSAGHEARLYAGAGIVADSHPRREWEETALKFNPLLDALYGATADD